MRLCDHPELLGFCNFLRENPGDAACIAGCTDWLMEKGATLADVLESYALPPVPKSYRKELLEAARKRGWYGDDWKFVEIEAHSRRSWVVVCSCSVNQQILPWLSGESASTSVLLHRHVVLTSERFCFDDAERTYRHFWHGQCQCGQGFWSTDEPETILPHADDVLRPVLVNWLQAEGDGRWQKCIAEVPCARCGKARLRECRCWDSDSAARVHQKRRVLRLFPEVKIVREGEVKAERIIQLTNGTRSAEFHNDVMTRSGLLPCYGRNFRGIEWKVIKGNRCWMRQTFAPEELLPPEPERISPFLAEEEWRQRVGDVLSAAQGRMDYSLDRMRATIEESSERIEEAIDAGRHGPE